MEPTLIEATQITKVRYSLEDGMTHSACGITASFLISQRKKYREAQPFLTDRMTHWLKKDPKNRER